MPARGGEGRRDGGREQAARGARRDPRWGGEEGDDAQRRWREDAIAMGAHDELQLRCMHVVARYTTANLSHETPANLVQEKSWNSRQIGVCVCVCVCVCVPCIHANSAYCEHSQQSGIAASD